MARTGFVPTPRVEAVKRMIAGKKKLNVQEEEFMPGQDMAGGMKEMEVSISAYPVLEGKRVGDVVMLPMRITDIQDDTAFVETAEEAPEEETPVREQQQRVI